MKKILIAIIVTLTLFGCSENKLTRQMPIERKMEIGNEYMELGKYHKAIPYFTDVVFERNSKHTAEAQMKLGDCYFYQNKFLEARFEYEELIRLFHDYKDINMAYFQIGVCRYNESLPAHYTQEETEKAVTAFETFIEKFPFDEMKKDAINYIQKCRYKLLEKRYYNGYAYYKMFDYSAALMYFDEIAELGNVDELDKMSLYYSAKIYITRKDKENAVSTAGRLTERYPGSKEAEKINQLLQKLK